MKTNQICQTFQWPGMAATHRDPNPPELSWVEPTTGVPMTKIRLQFIHEFRDRHGKVRRYFRRPGFKRIALPGLPGSDEFMETYRLALAGQTPKGEVGVNRTRPGSLDALSVSYFASAGFRSLSPSTQVTYRGIIDRFRIEHGSKPARLLLRRHLVAIMSDKLATPSAANNWLRMMRLLMQHAIETGLREDDPTTNIKAIKIRGGGFKPWSDEQIAAYRARHAIGTRARLALELLLSTGQRRGDVVRMGRQHVRNGTLSIRQQKTGMLVEIPILPDLKAALDELPADQLTFLMTDFGKPFTAAGFGNWFRERCNEAGLPNGYAAHGLRKAAATHHANMGATAHELLSWFGWTTLKEAERYTRGADRKQLAQGMGAKLISETTGGKPT